MMLELGQRNDPQHRAALDALRAAMRVVQTLGIRVDVSLPRRPGLVEDARSLAESMELEATVEIGADEVCVHCEPRSPVSS